MHNFLSSVWLIPVVPMLATAWIAVGYMFNFNRGESGEKQTAQTALTASAISLLLVLIQDAYAIIYGAPGQIRFAPWLESGDYRVYLSFTLDNLGLLMATLVAIIALLMIKFSVNYMHREAGYQRFFMIMSLFNGAMLLIMLAGNAVLTFIGWELAGISSYLLIGYAFNRSQATANATQAFVTNRIGDAGFTMSIALSFIWFGSVEWSDILNSQSGLSSLHIGMIAGGFILAALIKSALVPFSPWISRALEGPTPSSAIFYGSLMVHAGIYLLIRLEPLLMQDQALLPILAFLGLLTLLYGFFSGLIQTDVKSALMFSVISQVGLMVFLIGIKQFTLATIYMVLHAIWRAYQFLNAPSQMHQMTRPTRPVNSLIQRWRWLYIASIKRFWLDSLANWLIVKPLKQLSRDARHFDDTVVTRIVGLPAQASEVKSSDLAENQNHVGFGRGIAGKLMQHLASALAWFEEHLVLKSAGAGLLGIIQHLGHYVLHIEALLSQPRYLIILIIATFVVIL
ncbi:MAG: proton-conducting transporter membrane subunit [Gammaproteobacteria bacterium]|nr:proton-conducting transporter membrane subunit [Gammaproteobacteria bacterium]